MEKAVLKTLLYVNYPMKAWEIHKWLIGRKATLRQVEKTLRRQNLASKIESKEGFYFLKGKRGMVGKRLKKEKVLGRYLKQARIVSHIFKIIPWVKMVGISGGFVVITQKGKLWQTRVLLLGILHALGKRPDGKNNSAGKVCLGILIEEDRLGQKNKDLFTAHEILQTKVLWQRDGMYSRFLEENGWVFKFLPNWTGKRD